MLALVASLPADQAMHPSQLELLLHEWGHALHTLLSRTRHQHLSGNQGDEEGGGSRDFVHPCVLP